MATANESTWREPTRKLFDGYVQQQHSTSARTAESIKTWSRVPPEVPGNLEISTRELRPNNRIAGESVQTSGSLPKGASSS